mgnify:CR=1 FL=1
MFGSMKDLGGLMKQAQQMQAKMAEMQAELETVSVEGVAGGGLVKVVLSGKSAMLSLRIDPSLAKGDEVEILEDLIIAAYSDAKAKLETLMAEKMKAVTGGLPLPPGMGF